MAKVTEIVGRPVPGRDGVIEFVRAYMKHTPSILVTIEYDPHRDALRYSLLPPRGKWARLWLLFCIRNRLAMNCINHDADQMLDDMSRGPLGVYVVIEA